MRKALEQTTVFLMLLLMMGTFTNLFFGSDLGRIDVAVAYVQSPLGLRVVEVLVYMGFAVFAVLHYRKVLSAMRSAWPFLLIGLVALFSTAWSVDPATTLRRSLVLLWTTLFGVYLGGRFSTQEFQKILLRAFLLMLGASLVFLLVHPGTVLDESHTGAFRGLTEHKNAFGEFMGVFLLLAITFNFDRAQKYARLATIVLAIVFLVWAESGAALLSVSATFLVLPLLLVFRFKKRQALPLAIIGVFILAVIFIALSKSSGLILGLADKDPTLTGRTQIWELVGQAIMRQPLLGYGYDAFWQGLKGPSLTILSYVGWNVPNSHNGYLETLLGLGYFGLSLVAVAVLRTGKDALAYARIQRSVAGLWPFAFLIYYLLHAGAEASLLKRDGLSYLLLVAISTSLAVQNRAEKSCRTQRLPARELLPSYERDGVLIASFENTGGSI